MLATQSFAKQPVFCVQHERIGSNCLASTCPGSSVELSKNSKHGKVPQKAADSIRRNHIALDRMTRYPRKKIGWIGNHIRSATVDLVPPT